MQTSDYSPYCFQGQMDTDKKQTTSYKKYPANKYLSYDDPTDIKHQLFPHQKYPHSKPNPPVFKNHQLRDTLSASYPDSVIEYHQPSYDWNCLENQPAKRQNPSKSKQKKSKKKIQNKKLRSKSCQLSIKQTKKTIPIKQENQELQMYKKLCLTLRKQNQDLGNKMAKQQKQQSKFTSEIQSLKQKISKMYNHCIQKNKSSKNVDVCLQHLIKKHINKENDSKKLNKDKQNNFFDNKKTLKSNKQTIDTTLTSKRDLNTSSFKSETHAKRKVKSIKFVQSQPRESLNSFRVFQNDFKPSSDHLQYDEQASEPERVEENVNGGKNDYKQFFTTFTKSLEIFECNQQKSKSNQLKQAGYEIQWAKQQWLQIVEYLIQKGYTSRNSLKKTKRSETTHKSIR